METEVSRIQLCGVHSGDNLIQSDIPAAECDIYSIQVSFFYRIQEYNFKKTP